tara:strand:- start:180 stop:1367 length:1188 start_codon:yes stop_codon:yes gene_type:complete
METQRRFKAVKIGLMRSEQFVELSPIMMLGKTTFSEDIPTACTDGRNEIYGLAFIESLDDKELGFLICHENMHKAARHLTIYNKLHAIDAQLTNIACDYWINGKLIKADPHSNLIAMPRKNGENIGCHDIRFDGMTVKSIFYILKQEQEDGSGSGSGSGEEMDEHDWDSAAQLSSEEQQKLEGDIKQAIMQGKEAAKRMGVGSGNTTLGLQDLIKVKVSWVDQLWEYARATCKNKEISTWRRPNRRFLHEGIYMPTLEGQSLREVVFAPDASGSMTYKNRLTRVVSVVKEIVRALNIDKVHVIYWDGEVGAHETYTTSQFSNFEVNTKPIGGGGTTPSCVPKYLKEHNINPELTLMLTDGEVADWGEWKCPVLWGIINSTKITAPMGKTVYIDEE